MRLISGAYFFSSILLSACRSKANKAILKTNSRLEIKPLFALPHAFVRGRSNIGSGSLVSFCHFYHFATLSSFHSLAGDKLRYCQPFQENVSPFSKGVNDFRKVSTCSGKRLSTTSEKEQKTVNRNQEKTKRETRRQVDKETLRFSLLWKN
jgi:hypothetical protein